MGVSDTELTPIIIRTLDQQRPREWNWALMDYGSHLKATIGNVNTQSKTHKKQSDFKTSNRYIRGAIIRVLSIEPLSMQKLQRAIPAVEPERLKIQLASLVREGLVVKTKQYRLP